MSQLLTSLTKLIRIALRFGALTRVAALLALAMPVGAYAVVGNTDTEIVDCDIYQVYTPANLAGFSYKYSGWGTLESGTPKRTKIGSLCDTSVSPQFAPIPPVQWAVPTFGSAAFLLLINGLSGPSGTTGTTGTTK